MRKIFTSFLFLLGIHFAAGQNTLHNYFPKKIITVDLGLKKQKELERLNHLLTIENPTAGEQQEIDNLLSKYGETTESAWDIVGSGCSWYCGGGNYDIKGSSSLADTKGISYGAKSANDLSYKTAWVAGNNKGGIGEFLEYYFKNESPRVTQIIISNGYLKTAAAWKNNNRVRKIKLHINGKPHGILNLQDSRTDQLFEVGALGHNKDGSDLVLRFEILEVYKGNKYNDTAITEIYFDGIDVH